MLYSQLPKFLSKVIAAAQFLGHERNPLHIIQSFQSAARGGSTGAKLTDYFAEYMSAL